MAQAVAAVNMAYNARLEELQAGGYYNIVVHGQGSDWPDVLTVFAVKTADTDAEGMEVTALDAARVEKLTTVFGNITEINTEVETNDHPGNVEDGPPAGVQG